MPEGPEYRIMSDFINEKSDRGRTQFKKAFHVSKGNIPELFTERNFTVHSHSRGKELVVEIRTDTEKIPIHVFMGMSGNWKWCVTEKWEDTKFVRFRMDSESGNSLILHGGYMGPKYSIGRPFGGTKRGPDPTTSFEDFEKNVLENLHKKTFDKPICEVLLNQEYFNGIGNYIRSTVMYYANSDPFETGRDSIRKNRKILELCRDVPLKSYNFHGGQLRDWSNPYEQDSKDFEEWVFYQKGLSCKDGTGRTFWFDPKWAETCPYKINSKR
jgi:endonuclease VIII-like 1